MQKMACLSCHSLTKTLACASIPSNNINSSPSPQPRRDLKPPIPIIKPKYQITIAPSKSKSQQQNKLKQQLELIQLEHAIGAGSYRDSEPKDLEQGSSAYKRLSPNSWGTLDESVEKKLVKLQETGEWIANKTEKELFSSGKGILMFVLQWVLPAYIFFFLVACGVVKLPFSIPLLDDLVM